MLEKELLLQIKEEILKAEYDAYIKQGRHYDLANKLNDTDVVVDKPVLISTLNSFADANGLLLLLEDVRDDNTDKYTVEVKKAVRSVLRVFIATYTTVDLTLPAVQWAFGTLVAANVLTQQVVDGIFALGKVTVPLSVKKFGVRLSSSDIADALKV